MLDASLAERIVDFHGVLLQQYPDLARMSVAVYDKQTDIVKTFAHSSADGIEPLTYYEATLSSMPTLQKCATNGSARIIGDIFEETNADRTHNALMRKNGIRSSYAQPIIKNEICYGFLFYNSKVPNYFTDVRVHNLSVYSQLVSLLLINEIMPIKMLDGALKTAREFSRFRDEETSGHLARMSRYAREIALEIAAEEALEDTFVEYLFQFTPLHDVGKIAIPDNILLKPGRLTKEEMEIMRTHAVKGAEIIDMMVDSFHLKILPNVGMLRNIIYYHHENWDGTGYPAGIAGEEIPLEARITSVADVFDALTSNRPYKKAWTFDEAFEFLDEWAGYKFETRLVEALKRRRPQITRIQQDFEDDLFG